MTTKFVVFWNDIAGTRRKDTFETINNASERAMALCKHYSNNTDVLQTIEVNEVKYVPKETENRYLINSIYSNRSLWNYFTHEISDLENMIQ